MMRSTIKTFFLTGGGLLATWLAVTPNTTGPLGLNPADAPVAGTVREVTLDDLKLLDENLRKRIGNMPLRPSTRNPFRFGKASPPATPSAAAVTPAVVALPSAPPPPSLYLSGIATEAQKRTAIISGDGQLYLVKEGEPVGGRYHVVTVDSDAVTLRDDNGTEVRLVLH